VYSPEARIVPPVAFCWILHVTDVSLAPVTVAVNCCVPFGERFTEAGETATDTEAIERSGAKTHITAANRAIASLGRAIENFGEFIRRKIHKECVVCTSAPRRSVRKGKNEHPRGHGRSPRRTI
jgi:hypothetical protein